MRKPNQRNADIYLKMRQKHLIMSALHSISAIKARDESHNIDVFRLIRSRTLCPIV